MKKTLLITAFLILLIVFICVGFGVDLLGIRTFYERIKCKFVKDGQIVLIRRPQIAFYRCVQMYEDRENICETDDDCIGSCQFTCKIGEKGNVEGKRVRRCQRYEDWLPNCFKR